MKKRWGAQPKDWKKLIDLGLGEDLLPVVSNPEAKIAPDSTMKAIGKTPSRYNDRGQVVGIGQWTSRKPHPKEVEAWSEEPDFGICLQTRNVRALDIDVDDEFKAVAIAGFINDWLGQKLPIRYREGSGKCLLAFRLAGDYGKRVMKCDGGMVEFLAQGQQFIAGGTHPAGKRYQWSEYEDFPTLTAEQFEDLWFALCEQFATEAPSERKNGLRDYEFTGEQSDETAKFLVENGHAIGSGRDGQIFINCPFAAGHSTEDNGTSTAYFPAGSGGYEQGHFVCLHASCANRHDDEYLDAYGLREKDFEPVVLTAAEEAAAPPDWARDKHGRPKATLYNLRLALERPDITGCCPKYDIFRDEIIFYSRDESKWQRESDEIFIEIRMRLEAVYQFHTIGRELIRDAVLWVAKKAKVDTAVDWLNGQAWDGVPRIERFFTDYMGCDDTEYTRAVSLYLWTGLAGRILEPGLKADMVPVLVSPEGYKKTWLIESLAPTPDEFVEIDMSERDADIARKMRGKLVAEIAELRGLRTRELESILAFISRRFEEWIPKYREFSTTFPRRLMFIATTNEDQFLEGARRHRRWLPLKVVTKGDVVAVRRDKKLLWAEARERFQKDGLLFDKAERLGDLNRSDYQIRDAWEDVLSDWLSAPDDLTGEKPVEADFIRTVDIARFALGMDPKNLKRGDEMKIANAMKALGYQHNRVFDKALNKQVRAWTIEKDVA